MKLIPLVGVRGSGKFAKVDDDDYARIGHLKWWFLEGVNTCYARRNIRGRTIQMHREIMGATKGTLVDHINGNGLDNRKKNLRFCTTFENQQNRHLPTKNKIGGLLSVYWHKGTGKWSARVKRNKKEYWLGLFTSPKEAEKVVKRFKKQWEKDHGN